MLVMHCGRTSQAGLVRAAGRHTPACMALNLAPPLQIADAASALKPPLQALLSGSKGKGKGFGATSTRANRFAIELPVADMSAAATARLAGAVLAALDLAGRRGCKAVFADPAAAQAAQGALKAEVLDLRQACQADALSGPLLLVAPSLADVSATPPRQRSPDDRPHAQPAVHAACGCAIHRQHGGLGGPAPRSRRWPWWSSCWRTACGAARRRWC